MKALALLLLSAGYTADEAAGLFREAGDAYARGEYEEAITRYQKLLAAGLGGPDVEFNLGTTHLARGALGPAVLHLERAVRQGGQADDVEANLALARERRLDSVEGELDEAPFLERVGRALPAWPVTVGFLLAWWLGLGLLALGVWRRALVTALLGGLATAAALGLGGLVALNAWATTRVVEAVVVADTAAVREVPSEGGRVAFEVHAGLKVRVMGQDGRYVKVRLPNALEGWTERQGVVDL